MKSQPSTAGADDGAAADQPVTPGFHVELTPLAADARPFHALHGTVTVAAVTRLPSHIEEVIVHPPPKLP